MIVIIYHIHLYIKNMSHKLIFSTIYHNITFMTNSIKFISITTFIITPLKLNIYTFIRRRVHTYINIIINFFFIFSDI